MIDEDEFGPTEYGEPEQPARKSRRKGAHLRVAVQSDELWREGLDHDAKGEPRKTAGNGSIALQNLPQWSGLRYDKFRQVPSLSGAPVIPGFDPPREGPLDDYSITFIGHWLSKREQICLGEGAVATAAEVASKAQSRAFHPIREYLEALTWDGEERLETWLTVYLGTPDSEFARIVGRMWMISAVARVMRPGCQADHMLILEGNQGDGKSTALEALAGQQYFADTGLTVGDKDSYQGLRGKWIYELGELDSLKGREVTRVKNFVSARVDNYRKSYGTGNADYPRQLVFAGTTNESHYLTDPTGNRRFWPVKTGKAGPIRIDLVKRDRDQLWAETLHRYLSHETWHITDKRVRELSKAEQADREMEDVWLSPVSEWLRMPAGIRAHTEGVSIAEVLGLALKMDAKDQEHRDSIRMGKVLGDLGFTMKPGRGKPRKYWKPPEGEDPF